VPVTARLSQKFYATFGEDVTNELVDWFNAVDSTYKAELRELADLYFARFEAKLDQRMAELKAELIKWMFLFWAGTALAGLLFR